MQYDDIRGPKANTDELNGWLGFIGFHAPVDGRSIQSTRVCARGEVRSCLDLQENRSIAQSIESLVHSCFDCIHP